MDITNEVLIALAAALGKPVHHGWVSAGRGVHIGEGSGWVKFDPANNPAQAMDVLCWLMNREHGVSWALSTDGDDNTRFSLSAAILQAACRVVFQ